MRIVLIVMLSFALLIVLAGQAVAQDATDPLADLTADIGDTTGDDGIPDVVTIAVTEDCTVDQEEATVVVEDPDGTRVTLTNGDNVEITETDDGISITAAGAGGNLEGGTSAGGDDPPTFDPGQGTVIESTGITCGGDTTGGTTGETTGGKESLCEGNEELVGSLITGREDITTPAPFGITGPAFRVVVRATSTSTPPASGSVTVEVLDEDGNNDGGARAFVTEFDSTGTDSTAVIDGPGAFDLQIDADGASYEIAFCQTSGESGGTDGYTDDNDGGGGNDDGVIDNTIPKKPLPDTGGSTALMVGGSALLLLYGGLVAWRLKTRER